MKVFDSWHRKKKRVVYFLWKPLHRVVNSRTRARKLAVAHVVFEETALKSTSFKTAWLSRWNWFEARNSRILLRNCEVWTSVAAKTHGQRVSVSMSLFERLQHASVRWSTTESVYQKDTRVFSWFLFCAVVTWQLCLLKLYTGDYRAHGTYGDCASDRTL